jgi:hypothetical protein
MGKEAKFVVRLNDAERQSLQDLLAGKRVAADKILRARILLKADADGPGWSDPEIAEAFNVGASTIHRLRQRLVEEGLDAALVRRPSSQLRTKKIDGATEAHLIAISCAVHPKVVQAGRCSCWRTSWLNCNWSIPSRARPSARR